MHSYGLLRGAFRPADGVVALRNCRIKASEVDIARALHGNWRHEHLFALKQALAAFDFCGQQLAELDAQLQSLRVNEDEPAKGRKRSTARNAPKFDLRTRLYVTTALVVVSETGADLCRFPTSKHFASRLGLSPGTKISGGKLLSGRTLPNDNRAAQALRLAAAAHKLARLLYAMLTRGQEYTDRGQDYFEERYRHGVVACLGRRPQQLGMKLVPETQTA